MADSKASALPVAATLAEGDLFYVVTDPGGTPASETATAAVARTRLDQGPAGVDRTVAAAAGQNLLLDGPNYVRLSRGGTPVWDITTGNIFQGAAGGAGETALALTSGTPGTPGHTFVGDTDTGLAWIAANIQALVAGGIEMLRIGARGTPPASASATGTPGQIVFGTDDYLYVCSATDTWLRMGPFTTWV
jgi:hypothetical protein